MVSYTFLVDIYKMIIAFILVLIPLATPISFNLTSFQTNDSNMIYELKAHPNNGVIQLISLSGDFNTEVNIGRATYAEPLHLWDKTSRNLADFTTTFSFIIDSNNNTNYADGLTFFLAPNGSRIPKYATIGSNFGLTLDDQATNSTDNPFVAIEFDIYPNDFDPSYTHVGIDINSIVSVANVNWSSAESIIEGREHEATIRYNSTSMNLSMYFTGLENGSFVSLYHIVNLSDLLPEFVSFGFSAASGADSAYHSINSWSFSSTLEIDGNITAPGPVTDPVTSPPVLGTVSPQANSSAYTKAGVAIGLAIGGLLSYWLVSYGDMVFIFCNS